MALLDLSQVTDTLIRLLRTYVSQPRLWGLPEGGPVPSLSITGNPPDLLAQQSDDYALSVYLYHIEEDEYRKNLPEPPGSSPPVSGSPMGLHLYYLLTAHGGTSFATAPYGREQRLMGLAVKAFHDYPMLNATTRIGTEYVLPDILRGRQEEFRLVLHPATLEDLNRVWTAVTTPLRLSAIYQVSVVLLEAEPPAELPLPVLAPRIDTTPLTRVWIESTESDCQFTLPGETTLRSVTHSPALVAVGERFRIVARGVDAATSSVFLSSPAWTDPPHVDVTEWITSRSADGSIELLVASPVSDRAIVPGLYQVHIADDRGPTNYSPLSIAPVIAHQTDPTPGIDPAAGPVETVFSIRGEPFSSSSGDIRAVAVFVASRPLTPTGGSPAAGEFQIVSATEIQARVPAGLAAGAHPIRVAVNGVSTLPVRWFEVTG